jgi:hypothetical protein
LIQELLAQDVGVAAVLRKFPDRMEVHPAQGQRAAPVAVKQIIEPERGS